MPNRIFPGVGPFDPRQPRQDVFLPERKLPSVYTQQSPASPVHLSASLVMPSGSNGTVPAAALKNPMGQDMELLEIKFELSGGLFGFPSRVFGGSIACELMMGNFKLTNGAIPVWNFGRAENLDGESLLDFTNNLAFMSYSWRLPRPLFVPAGAVVVPNFTHTGFVSSTINVRVGYSARTVFTKPKMVHLPWVSAYISKAFNPISSAGVDVSTELDLVNSNPEVLRLQRFVGRTTYVAADGTAGEDPFAFASQYLKLKITDSYGRPILRNYAPFRSVFGALTRSWEMDNGAELDPNAYYLVNLKKEAMTMGTAGGSAQAFMSMVGWREMPFTGNF